MAGDFGTQKGKFGSAPTTDPKRSGKPTAGITNDAKGKTVDRETPKGFGPNGSRIR